MVEDGKADMAHPDLVNVGEGEGEAHLDGGGILGDAAPLPAQVAGRAVEAGQATVIYGHRLSVRKR